jgi:hypothetical protein
MVKIISHKEDGDFIIATMFDEESKTTYKKWVTPKAFILYMWVQGAVEDSAISEREADTLLGIVDDLVQETLWNNNETDY